MDFYDRLLVQCIRNFGITDTDPGGYWIPIIVFQFSTANERIVIASQLKVIFITSYYF